MFFDHDQAQARRWFLSPPDAAYVCRVTDRISSGQAFVFRLARGSPLISTAYSVYKALIEEKFPHPFAVPLQLRLTRRGTTSSYAYRAHQDGNSWARVPALRFYGSTPNLPQGSQATPGFQLPVSALPRNVTSSSQRLPSVGGSLYDESFEIVPSESATSLENPAAVTPHVDEVEAPVEEDTIVLDPPASPSTPVSAPTQWMGEMPTLTPRNLQFTIEDEVTDSHVSAARSLNNPTADTTMDLWNELDQMFISEDHHSTGGETSEFEDAQDSVPKDEKNCEDRLAVSPFDFVSEVFPRFYLAPILCLFRFLATPLFNQVLTPPFRPDFTQKFILSNRFSLVLFQIYLFSAFWLKFTFFPISNFQFFIFCLTPLNLHSSSHYSLSR